MAERRRPTDPALDYRNWGVLAGRVEDRTMIARVRMDAMEEGRGEAFTQCITLSVTVQEATPEGLPTMEEMGRLDQIETRIHDLLRERGGAILALLISTAGRREIVLYGQDHGWIETHRDVLDTAIGEHAAHVVVTPDPDWSFYKRFREHAR